MVGIARLGSFVKGYQYNKYGGGQFSASERPACANRCWARVLVNALDHRAVISTYCGEDLHSTGSNADVSRLFLASSVCIFVK